MRNREPKVYKLSYKNALLDRIKKEVEGSELGSGPQWRNIEVAVLYDEDFQVIGNCVKVGIKTFMKPFNFPDIHRGLIPEFDIYSLTSQIAVGVMDKNHVSLRSRSNKTYTATVTRTGTYDWNEIAHAIQEGKKVWAYISWKNGRPEAVHMELDESELMTDEERELEAEEAYQGLLDLMG